MRILLVEPAYKNKYPPIGLMKLSTYHKKNNDYVFFTKGIFEDSYNWDRIYITSLFTFDYKEVVKTIEYYTARVENHSQIYVGGILASLLTEKLEQSYPQINIITGRLFSSNIIGFNDDVNIDSLPLDYDILDLVDYKYATDNCVIAYTSRGCINKCSFCAVPKLEGNLTIENSITSVITSLRKEYSDKKDLLLLDNNILGFDVEYLSKLTNELNDLGFINSASFKHPNKFNVLIKQYYRFLNSNSHTLNIVIKIQDFLDKLASKKNVSKVNKVYLRRILELANESDDYMKIIIDNYHAIYQIVDQYSTKIKYQRYIDFNQGLDARELTDEKMAVLSRLPIKPYRFAFDSLEEKDSYINAVTLAAKYDVKSFSNYLLYNFNDSPEDLYERILINLELSEKLDVTIYSFPMKFAAINRTDRKYVGSKWNLHFLRTFQSIINVTKGVVAGDRSFIEKAFGSSVNEFIELLHMPHDFIVYRSYFENNGYTEKWRKLFLKLSNSQKEILVDNLSNLNYQSDCYDVNEILKLYKIKYLQHIRQNTQ